MKKRGPKKDIDRDRTRTCNPQIRSLVPYPLGHTAGYDKNCDFYKSNFSTFSRKARTECTTLDMYKMISVLANIEKFVGRKYLSSYSMGPLGPPEARGETKEGTQKS